MANGISLSAVKLSSGWENFFGRTPRRKERQKLDKLSPTHRKMIYYHLQGISHKDIATLVGVSQLSISSIFSAKLIQEEINRLSVHLEMEMDALFKPAINAIRDGLVDDDIKNRMSAADRVLRATGKYQRHEKEGGNVNVVINAVLAKVSEMGNVKKIPNRRGVGRIIDITPNKQVERKELEDGS